MAEYMYIAADRAGKKIEGKMEANNEGELRMSLRSQGYRPISIKKASMGQVDIGTYLKSLLGGGDSVKTERLMNFIRQLQIMINSGVPLVQALELFHDQESDPTLKRILGTSQQKINSGSFLWECFAAYPTVFERVFVALIRAGESSGTLDVMLKRVGRYLENSYRLKKLIKSSMSYPITVTVIAVGVVAMMLTVVIPKFEEMIVGTGGELPGATKFVLFLSHWTQDHFLALIVGSATVFFLFRSYIRTKEGRIVFQKFMLSMPLFGSLIIRSGVARFSRTMSTLLSSGVPLVDSLEICIEAADHIAFQDAITQMKKSIEMGSSFTSCMVREKVFPKMATQMASVGENTGNLDKMLEKVADFYEEEVEEAIAGIMKLIEPIMMVFMGGLVGGLMIAMYMPIFQMAGGVK